LPRFARNDELLYLNSPDEMQWNPGLQYITRIPFFFIRATLMMLQQQ
jgi:hypothetical protein